MFRQRNYAINRDAFQEDSEIYFELHEAQGFPAFRVSAALRFTVVGWDCGLFATRAPSGSASRTVFERPEAARGAELRPTVFLGTTAFIG
jgi:hypothetical protein